METDTGFAFCRKCGYELVVAYPVPRVGVMTVFKCSGCLTWHVWAFAKVQAVVDKHGAAYVVHLN